MSERSKAERRLIRVMEKRGGKGFLILRSAEMPMRQYGRTTEVTSDGEANIETDPT